MSYTVTCNTPTEAEYLEVTTALHVFRFILIYDTIEVLQDGEWIHREPNIVWNQAGVFDGMVGLDGPLLQAGIEFTYTNDPDVITITGATSVSASGGSFSVVEITTGDSGDSDMIGPSKALRELIDDRRHDTSTYRVYPGQSIDTQITAAVAGQDVWVMPGTYTENVTVPTGINLIGSGTNCVLAGNLVIQSGGSAKGILISDGYYVEQDGVKYYA
jgi:hypothetical protein